MNQKAKFLVSFVAAGIISFILLNLFCVVFSNPAIRKKSETHSTDYIWEKGSFYSSATEGFAYGFIDENGFLNTYNKKDRVDILVMGSSQVEATNVFPNQSTVYKLNEYLNSRNTDLYAYNIGISGHYFEKCVSNMNRALEEFQPSKYLIIETNSLDFSFDDMEKALTGSVETHQSYDKGFIYYLQKLPFLRRCYSQYSSLTAKNDAEEEEETVSEKEYNKALESMLSRVSDLCEEYSVTPIVFFHSAIEFDSNGKIEDFNEPDKLNTFQNLCAKHDIIFQNMYPEFREKCEKEYVLPHGFSNTIYGTGHLNKDGHDMIAKKLTEIICELEKAKQ